MKVITFKVPYEFARVLDVQTKYDQGYRRDAAGKPYMWLRVTSEEAKGIPLDGEHEFRIYRP